VTLISECWTEGKGDVSPRKRGKGAGKMVSCSGEKTPPHKKKKKKKKPPEFSSTATNKQIGGLSVLACPRVARDMKEINQEKKGGGFVITLFY